MISYRVGHCSVRLWRDMRQWLGRLRMLCETRNCGLRDHGSELDRLLKTDRMIQKNPMLRGIFVSWAKRRNRRLWKRQFRWHNVTKWSMCYAQRGTIAYEIQIHEVLWVMIPVSRLLSATRIFQVSADFQHGDAGVCLSQYTRGL